jgi:hypothetical protein
MSEKLAALIERARLIPMTEERMQEQEIGFAYGNVHYENPRVTREMVARSLPGNAGSDAGPTQAS